MWEEKSCGIKHKNCECFLEYTNFKDNGTECRFLSCNKNYKKKFHENLKKLFLNTYKCFNLILVYCIIAKRRMIDGKNQ